MPKKKQRKTFFKQPSVAKIKEGKELILANSGLISKIQKLNLETQVLVIEKHMLPKDDQGLASWRKYGPTINLRTNLNLQALLKKAIDNTEIRPYAGVTFKPFKGDSNLPRRYLMWDVFEGMRLAIYEHMDINFVLPIGIKIYKDTSQTKGAEATIIVSSRSKGQRRYGSDPIQKATSIPIKDNKHKTQIAHNFSTDHTCAIKSVRNIRFGKRANVFCPHEIAAYFAIANHLAQQGNRTAYEETPFPVFSPQTIDFCNRLDRHVLVKEEKLKRPRLEIKEMLLNALLIQQGYDATCKRQGQIRSYSWK